MSNDSPPQANAPEPIPITPALAGITGEAPAESAMFDRRAVWLGGIAIAIGAAASVIAVVLIRLIAFFTNFAFYGRVSLESVSPAGNQLGVWVVTVPVVGALIVGFMARYGSKAIRGHGIPEAMEQVLVNRSRIPARITLLKPLSSAISIGTGGPFGAEGPIIATGGALGSLVGQFLRISAVERKTLVAVGAAAGMAATFGTPVSAVLLVIELLLFEFRPRSFIPVALATTTATGIRLLIDGGDPVFPMAEVATPTLLALIFYVVLGGVMGGIGAGVTWIIYAVEDAFERLPIHWMWWPALGAIAVGVVGYFSPRTMGVGYENITAMLSTEWTSQAIFMLCTMKFISWSISIGSGTSGGTLAPMFTIGGGIGHLLGAGVVVLLPMIGIDIRVGALVGMASIFAGAARAMLASAVFAFEATQEPNGLLPLLGGCAASYLVASLLMKNSLMTEKIARRGIVAPQEFLADPLQQVLVSKIASPNVVVLRDQQTVAEARHWIAETPLGSTHQGFPVVNSDGRLIGVLTRRDLLETEAAEDKRLEKIIPQPPRFVYEDCTARQAADHMINHDIGRLPVVSRSKPPTVVGIITRSDILSGYRRHIEEAAAEPPTLRALPRKTH